MYPGHTVPTRELRRVSNTHKWFGSQDRSRTSNYIWSIFSYFKKHVIKKNTLSPFCPYPSKAVEKLWKTNIAKQNSYLLVFWTNEPSALYVFSLFACILAPASSRGVTRERSEGHLCWRYSVSDAQGQGEHSFTHVRHLASFMHIHALFEWCRYVWRTVTCGREHPTQCVNFEVCYMSAYSL